ncbi:MAG: acyl--CoA ligase [Anaerolineae bacterium]|nr:acyl--CoA ligase [Anaerolineae bacterium]
MLSAQSTMYEALAQVAAARTAQEALICDDVRLTYGQLLARIAALARGLQGLGVGQGDRVLLILPPGPEFVLAFFAAARLGAVIVPLSPQARARALSGMLEDAAPSLVVATHAHLDGIDLARSVPHALLVGEAEGAGRRFEDLLRPEGGAADRATGGPDDDATTVTPDDLLALLYTSGTTGAPKGTMHTHRSLIAPVVASTKLRELWLKRPNLKTVGQMAVALARYRQRLLRAVGRPQTFLSTVGWHTITGLEIVLQALLMGDRLVVMPRFHPKRALELIERERVTVLIAVPTAFQVMVNLQAANPHDTSSLLICGTGAAPCPPELARQMQEQFGCAVHIGFGATETGGGISATSIADSDARQAETVGQPMPGMEVRIVDEARREVPPGVVGELACRSESIMVGYYRAPEATSAVLDQEGWYYTGDLARVDERGYLQIVGRKRDLIIRGGQNIYPAEIEAYLTTHPMIHEAAVVGVPASVGGEEVWAFILLEDGATTSEREVLDYCRAALEPYQVPRHVCFMDAFPRSETGKPRKFELREQALRERPGKERG